MEVGVNRVWHVTKYFSFQFQNGRYRSALASMGAAVGPRSPVPQRPALQNRLNIGLKLTKGLFMYLYSDVSVINIQNIRYVRLRKQLPGI